MKHAVTLSFPLVAVVFAIASPAHAVDWYVSPTGTLDSACTARSTPCKLGSAAFSAVAGDTIILASGSYGQLFIQNSGTEAAPITIKADDCATPIIESAVSVDADQLAGVSSEKGEYLRFEGLIVRGWSTGFGNHWVGGTDNTDVSNGHWTIKNCISYSNGRTGFTFFSAPSFQLIDSIAAHNGTSTEHAWSSGVTLFETTGTNLVQGVISFENTDEQKHTDGSGFIVDEGSNNAIFSNNLAFGNSGSCFRLTKSSGTTFVNNTCYHNSQFGSQATGPTNPSELYFTNAGVTIQDVNFKNNVIVGTGTAPAGSMAIQNQPTTGWSNNVVSTGAATFFSAPEGTNPDFTLTSAATTLINQGATGAGVPSTDIGFDPKCLVKRAPKMFGLIPALGRWQYDVDTDYIAAKGGVAKCFNASPRPVTPDIGAYNNGPVQTYTETCTQGPGGTPTTGGGGASSSGGGTSIGGAGPAASGAPGSNTSGGVTAAGGATPGGNTAGTSSGAAAGVGTSGGAGNGSPPAGDDARDASGCGCRLASSRGSQLPSALGLLSLTALAVLRRRRPRS